MLRRAVKDDAGERLYWQLVHADSSSSPPSSCGSSPGSSARFKDAKVESIADIEALADARPLRNHTLYHPGSPLFNHLTGAVLCAGGKWGMSVRPQYLESDAGRALLMQAAVHAAGRRVGRGSSRRAHEPPPTFASLLAAYFWAPLVHRIGDRQLWHQFYRQQHRLNTRAFIDAGLAVGLETGSRRYGYKDIRFKSDRELAAMWRAGSQ